jgi:hypothetical protein
MFANVYEDRRGDEFSLNWEQTNQMSNYQMRKSKNREITGKITTQAIIQNRELPRQPPTQKDCKLIATQMNASSMKTPI